MTYEITDRLELAQPFRSKGAATKVAREFSHSPDCPMGYGWEIAPSIDMEQHVVFLPCSGHYLKKKQS